MWSLRGAGEPHGRRGDGAFRRQVRLHAPLDRHVAQRPQGPHLRRSDYDYLSKTLDISAISFHKAIQVARKKDAINDWGSIVALPYIAAQRTLYGYNDMADAKALLESIAPQFRLYLRPRRSTCASIPLSQSPTPPTTAGNGVLGAQRPDGVRGGMSPLNSAPLGERLRRLRASAALLEI